MTVVEAQAQVTAAEFQLAQQRAKAQTAQEQSAQQLRQIQTAQEKLPSHTSQSALRQKMAGIAGMIKRKAIAKVKSALTGKKEQVQKYQKGIDEYKQELTKYELEKINPVKEQIKQAQRYDAAVKKIKSAGDTSEVELIAKYGTKTERQVASQYLLNRDITRDELKTQISTFETTHPGEKLVVDWKNLRVKGIESGSLGQTLSLKEYNKKVKQFKPETIKVEEFKAETLPSIKEKALIKPTFLQKIKGAITGSVIGGGIPIVSALQSDTTALKVIDTSKLNDTNVSTRKTNRLGNIPPVRNFIADSIFNASKDFKKGFQEEITTKSIVSAYDPKQYKPTYIPQKTFLQKITSIPSIGLASAREFSERQAALVSAESLLGFAGISSVSGTKVTDIKDIGQSFLNVPFYEGTMRDVIQPNKKLIENIKNLKNEANKYYKDYQNLNYYEIPKFESVNKANGKFDINRLSNTKYQEYTNLINRAKKAGQNYQDTYTKYQDRIKDTSKTFYYPGGYKREVPVAELSTPFGYVKEYGLLPFRVAGSGYGSMYEDIVGKSRISKSPFKATGQLITGKITGKEFFSGFKETKPDVVYDTITGIARTPTGLDLKPSKESLTFVQPEEVTKVATGIFTTGAYFTPVLGGTLFGADIGEYGVKAGTTLLAGEKLTREQKIEGALLGGLVLGAGALRATRIIKNKAITKAIKKSIETLEKNPIKSLIIVDEGAGLVAAKGIREVNGIQQEVTYYGKIKQTEKGIRFIASGGGAVEARGIVKPTSFGINLQPRKFATKTKFEFGAKGKDLLIGNIKGLEVSTELGTTTTIPKTDYFGITTKTGEKGLKELKKQLAKGRPSDSLIIKDITIPTRKVDSKLILEINEKGLPSDILSFQLPENALLTKGNIGLRINEKELGTIITIPKKTEIEVLGFKGKGKKSSDKFFKDLYSPKIQPKPVIKTKPVMDLSIPKVTEITEKIKTVIPKIKSETTFGIPLASAYAGTGLYERTEPVSAPLLLKTDIHQVLGQKYNQNLKFKVGVSLKPSTFQTQKQREILDIKSMTDLGISHKLAIKENIIHKTDLRVSQATRVKQATKQRQSPFQITHQRITPKVATHLKPKIIILPSIKPEKGKKALRLPKKEEEEFLGITKRYGKEVIVARARTAKEAEMITKKDVLGTLGATVKVRTKAGRQVQLVGDKTFRLSKVDPLALVQKKTRRLAAIGERIEIKQARKGKTKKKVTKKRFSLK